MSFLQWGINPTLSIYEIKSERSWPYPALSLSGSTGIQLGWLIRTLRQQMPSPHGTSPGAMLRYYQYLGSSDKRMIQGYHQCFINTWRGDKLAYTAAAAALLKALPDFLSALLHLRVTKQNPVWKLTPEGFLSTMNPHSSKKAGALSGQSTALCNVSTLPQTLAASHRQPLWPASPCLFSKAMEQTTGSSPWRQEQPPVGGQWKGQAGGHPLSEIVSCIAL